MRVIIILIGLISFNLFSQTVSKKNIAYGESVPFGTIENGAKFTIVGPDATVYLTGSEINDYVFSKPGNYTITSETSVPFTKGDCNHQSFPKIIEIVVGRSKMKFDASQIQFSESIIKNKDMEGATFTIPVFIETYDHKPIVLNNDVVNVAGIGSSLTAKLDTSTLELSEGLHILSYTLSGKVSENAHLMFDFIKSDGTIQSVALSNPVQNQ